MAEEEATTAASAATEPELREVRKLRAVAIMVQKDRCAFRLSEGSIRKRRRKKET